MPCPTSSSLPCAPCPYRPLPAHLPSSVLHLPAAHSLPTFPPLCSVSLPPTACPPSLLTASLQVLPLNYDPQVAAAASAAAQKAMEEAAVASRLASEAVSEDTEEKTARQQRIDALNRVGRGSLRGASGAPGERAFGHVRAQACMRACMSAIWSDQLMQCGVSPQHQVMESNMSTQHQQSVQCCRHAHSSAPPGTCTQPHKARARGRARAQVDEETAIQLQPLGLDRRYNRYWRLAPTHCDSREGGGAQDPGIGRIFVEAADGSRCGFWRCMVQAVFRGFCRFEILIRIRISKKGLGIQKECAGGDRISKKGLGIQKECAGGDHGEWLVSFEVSCGGHVRSRAVKVTGERATPWRRLGCGAGGQGLVRAEMEAL